MKTRIKTILAASAITLAGCGSGAPVGDYPELILGKWACEINETDEGVTISMTSDVEYKNNGTVRSANSVDLQVGRSQAKLELVMSGPWKLTDRTLSEGTSNFHVSVTSMSGPEFDQIGEQGLVSMLSSDIQEEMSSGKMEDAKITHLSENKLTIKTVEDGYEMRCERNT